MSAAADPHHFPAGRTSRPDRPGGGEPGDTGQDGHDARVVPLYALAQHPGREVASVEGVPWEAMVTATRVGLDSLPQLKFEQAQIVELGRRPVSVAEVGAHLRVPLGVARLLVSELCDEGMVTAHVPRFGRDGRPSSEVLDRLLAGLRSRQDQ